MKTKRLFSFITAVIMVFSICTLLPVKIYVPFEASASGVDNIVARADYLYNTTWTAQATVKGWRNNYTFSKGSTYHIPYGQPVTKGKYICWGVSVDNFLSATQNASSEFYSTCSYYSGNSGSYSTYYAMDCSALASYCWDLPNRTTTSSWNGLSVTSYGKCTSANVNKIQTGDALNLAGSHIVIVSDVIYDSSGNVTQVEITEQTPPEIKRSYYTASSLVSKYSSYTIYRYNKRDSVTPPPNVPNPNPPSGEYFPKCDSSYDSLIEALDSIGVDSSKAYRKRIAEANGISDYSYSAEQNTYMLNLLKEGRLISPDGNSSSNNKKWYDDMTPVNIGECFTAYIINTACWKHLTAEDNDNVMMTSETRKAEQMWQFTRKADGSYKIINCKTGKALDAGGTNSNLYTYDSCDNSWQSWYIYGSSGAYYLKSQESDYVIDIVSGCTDDGTNTQIYEYNGTDAQKFQIYMLDDFGNLGTIQNLGECFTAYIINTEAWKHLTVEDNDNVMMTSETRKAEQMWQFTRKADGSYRIINCKTGKALDAGGADDNLYTYASCDNGWQSWYIFGSSGSYFLKSQGSNNVIDITGGYTNDGTNAQMYETNNTAAQKFQIYMLDGFGNLGTIQNLGECFTAYIINTGAWKHLTIEDNDNVMMTSETRKAEQMWQFTRKADGSYRIINCKTGKALDAGGAGDNLYTYTSCDNGWQSWYIFGSSGSYVLKSQGSNNVIDITGGYTNDRTNAQMYEANGTVAQTFNIEKTILIGDVNADNEVNIADVLILQKWLLGVPNTELANWEAADLCKDDIIDVFDMIEMRKLLIENR
ncbi:MAG: RICIN domain-containing protein [Ruminococcus sp.]|nr:RICIN domain-containing protein [Ruminococcus sp.]